MAFFDFFRRKKKDNAAEEAQTAPAPETTEAEAAAAAEEAELAAAETVVVEESGQALDDTLAAVEHALEQENSRAIVSESVADGTPSANPAESAPATVAPTPAHEPEAAAVEATPAASQPEASGISFADVAEQLIEPDAASEPSAETPAEAPAAEAEIAPMPSETIEAAAEATHSPAEAAETPAPEHTPEAEAKPAAASEISAAAVVAATPALEAAPKLSWATRLKQGLTKSRDKMAKSLASVFGGGKIDEDLYEELETVLITSDMGMEATEALMKDVRNRVSLKGLKDGEELRGALKDALYDLIKPLEQPLVLPENQGEPFVIMLAGINGAGKTTSIGKLAKYFQAQGKSVLLAAGDTFRAAAREQLQAWGERNNVTVISQSTGDSAAVCFDAVQAAKARGIDIVLADTAGRLPTQLHLMEEIKKVKRVLQKAMPDAPHEIIVVLDANIGQNAVNQVKAFDDALGLTGLIVTKLDGTAKGGILAALASHRPIPVRYIGVGEGIDDLRPFDARAFVDALLD